MLVFSLPFCFLLPDDEYKVKLDQNDIVTLKLRKIIPKIFDERLPFRGPLKGELDNVISLKLYNPRTGPKGWVDKNKLHEIKDMQIVLEYKSLDKYPRPPQYLQDIIDKDVNINEDHQDYFHDNKTKRKIRFESDEEYGLDDKYFARTHDTGRKLILNCEVLKDRFGRCRYTRVEYTSNKGLHYEEEFDRAVRAVNILISYYRLQTDSYWITKITKKEIFSYKSIHDSDTSYSLTDKGYGQYASDIDENGVKVIKEMLIEDPSNTPILPLTVFHLKLDALKAFEEENYPFSLVYIASALESLIKIVLSYYYDEEKMKDIDDNYSVSKLIRKCLPDVFPEEDLKKYRKRVFEAMEIRNDIIHRGKTDLSKDQTHQFLKDCNAFIFLLLTEYTRLIDKSPKTT